MSTKPVYSPISLEEDAKFGDTVMDIQHGPKRHLRATIKEYQGSDTYVFLKIFKLRDGTFNRHQYISLTQQEFRALRDAVPKIMKRLPVDEGEEEEETTSSAQTSKRPKLIDLTDNE